MFPKYYSLLFLSIHSRKYKSAGGLKTQFKDFITFVVLKIGVIVNKSAWAVNYHEERKWKRLEYLKISTLFLFWTGLAY